MMYIVIEALYLFVFALVMALVEIEIEGANGWAKNLPTWYRTTGTAGRFYGRIMNSKPLTGYHLFMTILTLLVFHLGFFLPPYSPWSLADEWQILARYFIWSILWDFLWFVFNPSFGIENFKRKKIWWHAKSPWIFSLFPIDYLSAWFLAFLFASIATISVQNFEPLIRHGVTFGILLSLTFTTLPFADYYHRWHQRMRMKDDRSKIIPPAHHDLG